MKQILLISNDVLHYRQKVYNYLYRRFIEDGYDFSVLANKFQKVDYHLDFRYFERPFSVKGYIEVLKTLKPDIVILFLHLKDTVMVPLIVYCRTHGIKVIYWNIGINTKTPNARIKNAIFHCIQDSCDALLTYTPDTRKYYSARGQKKLFVAYNTLNLIDIDKKVYPSKDVIRSKYGIKEKKVILYISRMMPYKRADLLMELFKDRKDVAVVLVGPGFTPEQQKFCDGHSNIYYLGEKYGNEVNEIYAMGDVFSTPGHIGLAIVEAMFWGLPVVLLKGSHAPEIYYMKQGKTGYIADDEKDLDNYMTDLLGDDQRLQDMSEACVAEYDRECHIDRMYEGFIEAVRYCETH
jgi:glycosyltransferase involved in cell wall biosynthesis